MPGGAFGWVTSAFRTAKEPVHQRLRSVPPPEPPPGWLQLVLGDLVAVDVERWRRFQGTITRIDAVGEETWTLRLCRDECTGPGSLRTWFRTGANDTVPELLGSLIISGGALTEAGEVLAKVAITRMPSGNVAALSLRGSGLAVPQEDYAVTAPLPPREGVPGAAPALPDPAVSTAWRGFPPIASEVRRTLPIERLIGASMWLHGLGDVGWDLDEFVFQATLVRDAGPEPDAVLRVTADGPVEDLTPEEFDDGEWNRAEALDHDYVVTGVQQRDDEITIVGHKWLVRLRGQGLQVRLERLT